ncbi:MAG: ABC-type nitrate/sulfonate/bicarbonate transport system substrate-binding protein [Candidatus Azotimanducaceae bacterium]|jgi:ABC-type nitrate/sulfonate/bicarbonate transport system substrate-binding protein
MTDYEMPTPEKENITLGYLRLTDSAPIILALELGYFDAMGLNVTLSQEVSWAAVRDKLAAGLLDVAQMLSPLPAMITLGLSGMRTPLINSLVLSHNGNAISVSQSLMKTLVPLKDNPDVWVPNTDQLKQTLTFAVVHGFSTHHLLLRRWLRLAGIDPDKDVNAIVVPPSQMVDSLARGLIDGYCAGEPWNTLASLEGAGCIAAAGISIWPDAPEKVLSTTSQWHNKHPNTHLLIRVALLKACEWLNDPTTRLNAVEILAKPEYLNLPPEALLPALSGRIKIANNTDETLLPDFHRFNDDMNAIPSHKDTRALVNECTDLLGKELDTALINNIVIQTAREDLGVTAQEWRKTTTALAQ